MARNKKKSELMRWWQTVAKIEAWRWAVGMSVVFLFMFVYKMPGSIVGYGDSDMLITMGYKLGVMRSPGYPLYTLLLYGFTHIPGINPAMGGHLLSAILASMSVGVVFMIGWKLYERDTEKRSFVVFSREWERLLLVGVVSLGFGFSSLLWSMALVAEKYVLSVFLMALLLWMMMVVTEAGKKQKPKLLVAVGALLGLAVSHQWIFLTWVMVYGLVIYKNKKVLERRDVLTMLLAFLGCAVVPFSLLWSYSANAINFSYVVGGGLADLWSFVIWGYVGDGLAGLATGGGLSLGNMMVNFWEFTKAVVSDTGWWLVVAAIGVGLYVYRNKKKQEDFRMLAVSFLGVGVGLAVVLFWPDSELSRLEVWPQLLVLELIVAVLSWFGWREVVQRLGAAGVVLFGSKRRVAGVLSTLMLIMVLSGAGRILSRESLADYRLQEKVSRSLFADVEDKALVMCYSNVSCGGLAYVQLVEGVGSRVTVVPYSYLPGLVRIGESNLQRFDYDTYPLVLHDIATWNVGKRPVYAVDIFQNYFDLFGINFGFMFYIPEGYVGRLDRKLPEEFVPTDYPLSEEIVRKGGGDWRLLTNGLMANIARRHVLNASIYLKAGQRTRATEEVNVASNIYHLFGEKQQEEILMVREDLEKNLKSKYYQLGSSVESVDYIVDSVDGLVEVKLIGRAMEVAQGAVTVDPESVRARLTWAKILELAEFDGRAIQEYQNVLKLDANNAEAKAELRKLSSPVTDDKPVLFN